MPGALTPSSPRRGLALAMWLFSQCAAAVGLGDIEVRSALGQVLDARVPLAIEPGKAVDASCFSLMRDARDGAVPTLVRGALTLERIAGAAALRIRSPVTISEPALSLRIRAACPGQAEQDERQYTLLLDPLPGDQAVRTVPVVGASLVARPGDTLPSIAAQVFPDGATARAQYLAALREANPELARAGGALPVGAAVSLPDLRTYARGRTPPAPPPTTMAHTPTVRAAAPSGPAKAPKPAPPPPAALPGAPGKSPGPESSPARAIPAVAHPPAASRSAATGAFMLKLSAPDVDLTRTRGMDDRKRAQLRERLALLDEDDHVAAMLSLRNNVRRLESRVAELQLKLASMPPALATAPAPVARTPAPERISQPAKTPEPAKAAAATPQSSPAAGEPLWKEYLTTPWAWGLLVLALLAAVLMRRPRRTAGDGDPTPSALLPTPPPARAPPPADREQAPRLQPAVARDASLAAHLPEESRELRRRYIEERFPEIANRTLVLEDPSSVVKGARLLYEDGAIPRAVELLKFSIEEHPAEVRPWLALFEIFRLERLAQDYAVLARRFHAQHGNSGYWPKVRYFGRELDPANPIYREDAAKPAAASFDAVAENWLDAPMDFENEVLANELRQAVMGEAALGERDLDPNPAQALRTIEIFRVA